MEIFDPFLRISLQPTTHIDKKAFEKGTMPGSDHSSKDKQRKKQGQRLTVACSCQDHKTKRLRD